MTAPNLVEAARNYCAPFPSCEHHQASEDNPFCQGCVDESESRDLMLREAIAALPADQGEMVVVGAKLVDECIEALCKLADMEENRGFKDWAHARMMLIAKLRACLGEKS